MKSRLEYLEELLNVFNESVDDSLFMCLELKELIADGGKIGYIAANESNMYKWFTSQRPSKKLHSEFFFERSLTPFGRVWFFKAKESHREVRIKFLKHLIKIEDERVI